MEASDHGLSEAAMLVARQLCHRESNAFKFLYHDAMKQILTLLNATSHQHLHEVAAQVIAKVGLPFLLDWNIIMIINAKFYCYGVEYFYFIYPCCIFYCYLTHLCRVGGYMTSPKYLCQSVLNLNIKSNVL